VLLLDAEFEQKGVVGPNQRTREALKTAYILLLYRKTTFSLFQLSLSLVLFLADTKNGTMSDSTLNFGLNKSKVERAKSSLYVCGWLSGECNVFIETREGTTRQRQREKSWVIIQKNKLLLLYTYIATIHCKLGEEEWT
jgi:hypothetical protein